MKKRIFTIKEVFKTTGTPTYTYVERENGRFENSLESGIDSGKLCLITGPSKTGKSTLYEKVLMNQDKIPLIIRCDYELDSVEFWRKALESIDFERIKEVVKSNQIKVDASIKGRIEAGWSWIAKAIGEVTLGVSGSTTETKVREKILSNPSPKHLIPALNELPYILVVEDVHYLKPETQKSIFQQWKTFVDAGIPTIIVGTTHHAVDLAYANKDLPGRMIQIDVSTWSQDDLKKIIELGFKQLKVKITPSPKRIISSESVGLPIITQEICYKLFINKKVRKIDISKNNKIEFVKRDVFECLHDVAIDNYSVFSSFYKIISAGIKKKALKHNTYELLLLIFSVDPLTFRLDRSEIENRMGEIADTVPPKSSITSTLKNLKKLQETKNLELLEWFEKENCLYILEPAFLFYLRWREKRFSQPSWSEVIKTLKEKIALIFEE